MLPYTNSLLCAGAFQTVLYYIKNKKTRGKALNGLIPLQQSCFIASPLTSDVIIAYMFFKVNHLCAIFMILSHNIHKPRVYKAFHKLINVPLLYVG